MMMLTSILMTSCSSESDFVTVNKLVCREIKSIYKNAEVEGKTCHRRPFNTYINKNTVIAMKDYFYIYTKGKNNKLIDYRYNEKYCILYFDNKGKESSYMRVYQKCEDLK